MMHAVGLNGHNNLVDLCIATCNSAYMLYLNKPSCAQGGILAAIYASIYSYLLGVYRNALATFPRNG